MAALLDLPSVATFDWSAPDHYAEDRRRCRYCRRLTQMRDQAGRPAHKVCAEQHRKTGDH